MPTDSKGDSSFEAGLPPGLQDHARLIRPSIEALKTGETSSATDSFLIINPQTGQELMRVEFSLPGMDEPFRLSVARNELLAAYRRLMTDSDLDPATAVIQEDPTTLG